MLYFWCLIIYDMKILYYLSFLLLFIGCKKDAVDGSSVKSFQESTNEMATSLNTLEQTKFNEALYILKTFAVKGDTDMQQLEALARLINAKKVPEIFALADEIAKKNDVDWSSTSPPSLGEMNIFQNITAQEIDVNDIVASSLDILVKPIEVDSISGAKALRVIPKLLDNSGNEVVFSNAGLETIMEVYSDGTKLSTAKNIMTNNQFKGFYLKLNSLPADKVVDAKIDIRVSVKTTNKTHQFFKTGISVNENALKKPVDDMVSPDDENTNNIEKPEVVVNRFLNYLNQQNLKSAYDISENPNWGTYDNFSNPNSGFGSVKNISVKNISSSSVSGQSAVVNTTYQVTDKDGNILNLNVSYHLKQTENSWKISNYKINSSEKQ